MDLGSFITISITKKPCAPNCFEHRGVYIHILSFERLIVKVRNRLLNLKLNSYYKDFTLSSKSLSQSKKDKQPNSRLLCFKIEYLSTRALSKGGAL